MAGSETARGGLRRWTSERQVRLQTLPTGHTGSVSGNGSMSQGVPEILWGEELGQMELGGEDLDFCLYEIIH